MLVLFHFKHKKEERVYKVGISYTLPSLTTLSKATLCLWDIYPRKEKTTKPEKKLVKELMELVMMASLGQENKKSGHKMRV